MKKIFLMLLLVFCVVSCELKKAQEAYDKKEYLESMKIVLKYFEKYPNKLEKIKPEVKNDLMGKFSNIVNIYEGKAYNGNFDEKIEGYSSLGQIYMLMDKYSISQQFTDFTQKHNLSLIYENYENMISQRIRSNVDRMSYENIYKMIKKDYNKHIEFTEELMASNIPSGKMAIYREVNKKMTKSKADKLIELAQKYEYLDKYREAEKLYLEASKTYSRYDENYRQAKDKHFEIKRKADLIDAEKNYNLGLSKTREGTKASYRKATEYFEKAARFIPNYKNSKELARKYEEMGNIDYYISDCPNSVEKLDNNNLDKNIHTVIMSTAHPFKFPTPIAKALGIDETKEPYAILDEVSEITGVKFPEKLTEVRNSEIRFSNVIDKTDIQDFVKKYIKNLK